MIAIFIAELAFTDPALLGVAKLGILTATAVAATAGLIAGRLLLPTGPSEPPTELSASEIEASTDYWTSKETRAISRGEEESR